MSTYIDLLLDSESPEVDSDNPDFTLLPSAENIVGVCVVWANVPNTWNVVDRANGFFVLQTTTMANFATILLPNSNEGETYDRNTIGTQIKSQIAKNETIPLNERTAFQVNINPTTNKLTLYNPVVAFRMAFYTNSESLADMLGFTSVTTGISDNDDDFDWKVSSFGQFFLGPNQPSPDTNFLTGDKAVQLAGPNIMSIRSPSVRNTARSHDYNYSTLINFPISTLRGGNSIYLNPNPTPVAMNEQSLSQFQLRLTLGRRSVYWNTKQNRFTPYLSLNGLGFQVVVRLYMSGGPSPLRG